ncbi:MAG: hypothetical protein IJU03_00510 [Thermoguttaceae bacterium]|nr:hypothetical protein [Thermoguttaceae bacterium]
MSGTNRWIESGVVRKNALLRVKMTLAVKSSTSGASAVVGDFYQFNCKSKTIPSFSKAPIWTDVTDNPEEPSGFAYAGKPEQLETIALVTRTPIQLTYEDLLEHQKAGDVFTIAYVYDDPHETSIFTITVPNCQIIDVSPSGGDNESGSETTIRVLPEGGSAANMPTVSAAARS